MRLQAVSSRCFASSKSNVSERRFAALSICIAECGCCVLHFDAHFDARCGFVRVSEMKFNAMSRDACGQLRCSLRRFIAASFHRCVAALIEALVKRRLKRRVLQSVSSCALRDMPTRCFSTSLCNGPTMSGAAFDFIHLACRAARRLISASSLSGSSIAACGSLPRTLQQTTNLLTRTTCCDCLLLLLALAAYWQASHSSKPGSPGRIMHTGPSASGAASTATAGAAAVAAAAWKPPTPAPPLTPKPPAAPPPTPPAPPAPSPPPELTAFNAP